jgi:hypothetical protein
VHLFRFESTSVPGVAAETQVLVRAGEKNREITVTLGVPRSPGAAPAPPERPAVADAGRRGVPALAWVFGGIAVAALGTALAFDVAQAVDYSHLAGTCAPHCSPEQADHVGTERWIAGGAAGVGALALGAAAYVFFSQPAGAPHAGTRAVSVSFGAVSRGALAGVIGRF